MNSKNEILNRLRRNDTADQKNTIAFWADKEIFIDYPRRSDNLIDMFEKQFNKSETTSPSWPQRYRSFYILAHIGAEISS